MAENKKDRIAGTVREKAERRADTARQEVGEVVIDATGKYFPEAVRRRRRRDVASGFALGALAGFLVRYAVGER